jgi:flagellar biosynthesis chaperone FliJ
MPHSPLTQDQLALVRNEYQQFQRTLDDLKQRLYPANDEPTWAEAKGRLEYLRHNIRLINILDPDTPLNLSSSMSDRDLMTSLISNQDHYSNFEKNASALLDHITDSSLLSAITILREQAEEEIEKEDTARINGVCESYEKKLIDLRQEQVNSRDDLESLRQKADIISVLHYIDVANTINLKIDLQGIDMNDLKSLTG